MRQYAFALMISFGNSFVFPQLNHFPAQSLYSIKYISTHLNVAGPLERTEGKDSIVSQDEEDVLEILREVVQQIIPIFTELSVCESEVDHDSLHDPVWEKTIIPLSSQINACESILLERAAGDRKEEAKAKIALREAVDPLRPFICESPLLWRTTVWPCGYAGDFESVQMIMNNQIMSPNVSPLGRALENEVLKQDICQQHRNKMKYQGEVMIKGCIDRKAALDEKAEIITLACGPCPDLQGIQDSIENANVHFTLLEKDIGAINFCQSILKTAVLEKCDFVEGNVLHLHRGNVVKNIPKGGYDLILAGGLFDYLTDKMITRLLSYSWNELLATGGSIFFTNVVPEYKRSFHTEAILDWSLIGRSDSELRSICMDAGIPEDSIQTMTESTGITIMATCFKSVDSEDAMQ